MTKKPDIECRPWLARWLERWQPRLYVAGLVLLSLIWGALMLYREYRIWRR